MKRSVGVHTLCLSVTWESSDQVSGSIKEVGLSCTRRPLFLPLTIPSRPITNYKLVANGCFQTNPLSPPPDYNH